MYICISHIYIYICVCVCAPWGVVTVSQHHFWPGVETVSQHHFLTAVTTLAIPGSAVTVSTLRRKPWMVWSSRRWFGGRADHGLGRGGRRLRRWFDGLGVDPQTMVWGSEQCQLKSWSERFQIMPSPMAVPRRRTMIQLNLNWGYASTVEHSGLNI